MNEVGQLFVKLSLDISEFSANMESMQSKLSSAGEKMTSVGKNMTAAITLPIVGVGAASFQMAADLQDAMGATSEIYGKAGDDVKNWANGLESYYGVAENEALEYSNKMGSLLQNIGGLSEAEAAKQSQTLVELAGVS